MHFHALRKKGVVFLMKQVERQYHFLFSKYNFVIAAGRERNPKRERGVGEKQFGIQEIRVVSWEAGSRCCLHLPQTILQVISTSN